MNKTFSVTWNSGLGQWVVASEVAKGRKKSSVASAASVLAAAVVGTLGSTGAMAAASGPGVPGLELCMDGLTTGAALNSYTCTPRPNSSNTNGFGLFTKYGHGFGPAEPAYITGDQSGVINIFGSSSINMMNTLTMHEKKIIRLAAGENGTDAVNVYQLKDSIELLGGGATIWAGKQIAPTYDLTKAKSITGNYGAVNNVGAGFQRVDDALGALNTKIDGAMGSDYSGWWVRDNNGYLDKIGSGDVLTVVNGKNTTATYNSTYNELKVSVVDAPTFSGVVTAQGGIDMAGTKVINLATPTADGDAANKKYVDDRIVNIPGVDALKWNTALGAYDATHDGGTAPNKIVNVANGTVAKDSKDAVNGGQLAAVEANVNTDIRIIKNTLTTAGWGVKDAGKAPRDQQFGGFIVDADGNVSNPAVLYAPNSANSAAPRVVLAKGEGDSKYFVDGDRAKGLLPKGTVISNVASGVQDTDAANVGQVFDIVNAAGGTPVLRMDMPKLKADAGGSGADTQGLTVAYKTAAYYSQVTGKGDSSGSTAPSDVARAIGAGSIAIGSNAFTSAEKGTAMGLQAYTSATDAVALGAGSVANVNNTVSVGSDGTGSYKAFDANGIEYTIKNQANTRRIVNMAAGKDPTDAVNVSQLKGVADSVAAAIGGGTTVDGDGKVVGGLTIDGSKYNTIAEAIASRADAAGNPYFKANRNTDSDDAVVAGDGAVAAGSDAKALNKGAVALGLEATASAQWAIAVGTTAVAELSGVAVGVGAEARGHASVAIGDIATSSDSGVAIGQQSKSKARGVAMGGYADAGMESVAIGANASASGLNSVALGTGSIASEQGTFAVGGALPAQYRRIVNVADGVAASDVATVGQVDRKILEAINRTVSLEASPVRQAVLRSPSGTLYAAASDSAPVGIAAIAANDSAASKDNNEAARVPTAATVAPVAVTDSLVEQTMPGGNLAIGSATDGKAVSFAGTTGDRVLTGVAAGTADNQAVNIAQLKAAGVLDANGQVRPVASYDGTARDAITLGGVGATSPVAIHNVATGVVDTDAVNVRQLNDRLQQSTTQAVSQARTYTDQRLTDVWNGMDQLEGAIRQQDRRIDDVGAMSMASAQMVASATAASLRADRGAWAIGVGNQGSRNAVAAGFSLPLGKKSQINMGASFGGDDQSVGLGFGQAF